MATLEDSLTSPDVPFLHAVKRLPRDASPSDLIETYTTLLKYAKVDDSPGHNVIIVADWMLVIPRSQARQGKTMANASAMVGMVWITKEEVLLEWKEKGPMKLLSGFGVPV